VYYITIGRRGAWQGWDRRGFQKGGDINCKQCGIHKSTTQNRWLLLLFDVKMTENNISFDKILSQNFQFNLFKN
jgi:hypothetical protein